MYLTPGSISGIMFVPFALLLFVLCGQGELLALVLVYYLARKLSSCSKRLGGS